MAKKEKEGKENMSIYGGKLLNFTNSFVVSGEKRKSPFQSLIFMLSEYFLVESLNKRMILHNFSSYRKNKNGHF